MLPVSRLLCSVIVLSALLVVSACSRPVDTDPASGRSTNDASPVNEPESSHAHNDDEGDLDSHVSPQEAKTTTARVTLGDPSLTAGIPGDGPLTIEQIEAWLADEANHQVLEVKLPKGLDGAAAMIIGLDENPMTCAKIELGRQLYFDRRLSADGTVSCADCHHPDEGYGRHTQFGVGIGEQQGGRNSPVSYNRIVSGPQFWDGRAATLEDQAKGPIENPIEMGTTHEVATQTIAQIPGYKMQFEKIYDDGVNIDNIAGAIATFERAIVTGPSPYDYYEPLRAFEEAFKQDLEDLDAYKEVDPDGYQEYQELIAQSEAHPMSESAKRGREIFFTEKGRCATCHAGANFSDEKYHNLGVGMESDEPDLGRYVITKDEKDKGAFKTPTLRNVALSAPYMHDGSEKTLLDVVELYAKGGIPNPHLSEKMKKLDLSDQDKQDLVAFMEALTGEFPPVATGRLPE